jgi:hypothetical protein
MAGWRVDGGHRGGARRLAEVRPAQPPSTLGVDRGAHWVVESVVDGDLSDWTFRRPVWGSARSGFVLVHDQRIDRPFIFPVNGMPNIIVRIV